MGDAAATTIATFATGHRVASRGARQRRAPWQQEVAAATRVLARCFPRSRRFGAPGPPELLAACLWGQRATVQQQPSPEDHAGAGAGRGTGSVGSTSGDPAVLCGAVEAAGSGARLIPMMEVPRSWSVAKLKAAVLARLRATQGGGGGGGGDHARFGGTLHGGVRLFAGHGGPELLTKGEAAFRPVPPPLPTSSGSSNCNSTANHSDCGGGGRVSGGLHRHTSRHRSSCAECKVADLGPDFVLVAAPGEANVLAVPKSWKRVLASGDSVWKRWHSSALRSLAATSDGRLVAAGLKNGGVDVYDLTSGASAAIGDAFRWTGMVSAVALTPEGGWLATAGPSSGICVYEIEDTPEWLTVEPAHRMPLPQGLAPCRGKLPSTHLAFLDCGIGARRRRLACASCAGLTVWEVPAAADDAATAAAAPRQVFHQAIVASVAAVSVCGTRAAFAILCPDDGDDDNDRRRGDDGRGGTAGGGNDDEVDGVADGVGGAGDTVLQVWNVEAEQRMNCFRPANGWAVTRPRATGQQPPGRRYGRLPECALCLLAVGSAESGRVATLSTVPGEWPRVWDIESGIETAYGFIRRMPRQSTMSVALAAAGRFLVSGMSDGYALVRAATRGPEDADDSSSGDYGDDGSGSGDDA